MARGKIKLSVVRRIRSLSKLAEVNDEHTWNHTLRINLYSRLLARRLDQPPSFCEQIGLMAQMHDLGKVRIARNILMKPGALSSGEYEEVKKHPMIGAGILGPDMDFKLARSIALAHHERWDGSGYPFGLRGERIPLSGRIVAVADVYDALRSRRPYKPPYDHEKALEIMMKGCDRTRPYHFDPDVLAAFREYHDDMDLIYMKCMDRRLKPRLAA